MELKQKLLNIQTELKAPKNQYNSFGKYNYRNCEDILEAVKPLCKKEKVTLTLSDTIKNIGERYYVESTATLFDIESENQITVTAYAREEETKKGMDGSQITGASSSYARKYALNGLFNIDDTKDSDSTNEDKPKKETKTNKADEILNSKLDNQSKLVHLIKEGYITQEKIIETLNGEKANDVPKDAFIKLFKGVINET